MTKLEKDIYPFQKTLAEQAKKILEEKKIVYFKSQERTGKTLASLWLINSLCNGFKPDFLIVVKRKNYNEWNRILEQYKSSLKFSYKLTTYRLVHKENKHYAGILFDEAHNYLSAFPKVTKTWKEVRKISKFAHYLIYLSATPYGDSHSRLYHQFRLSEFTPWKYKSFYEFFIDYGSPCYQYGAGGSTRVDYSKLNKARIQDVLDTYFVGYTRKELGFLHEPKDVKVYVELGEYMTKKCEEFKTKRMTIFKDYPYVALTHVKMIHGLYQMEGGTLKIVDGESVELGNTEKIDWIKENLGDTKDVVIMHNYVAEAQLLKKHFKNARILQGTSHAEGMDLSMYEHLVIYSQDWSAVKYNQRRCRQANLNRETPIRVYFLLVRGLPSDSVYQSVAEKKKMFIDSMFPNQFTEEMEAELWKAAEKRGYLCV